MQEFLPYHRILILIGAVSGHEVTRGFLKLEAMDKRRGIIKRGNFVISYIMGENESMSARMHTCTPHWSPC